MTGPRLQAASFVWDSEHSDGPAFAGYYDPEEGTSTGLLPYFTREQGAAIIAYIIGEGPKSGLDPLYYDPQNDAFIIPPNALTEGDTYEGGYMELSDSQMIHVYAIGAWSWTWAYAEAVCIESGNVSDDITARGMCQTCDDWIVTD